MQQAYIFDKAIPVQQAHIFANADPENAIPSQQTRIFDNAIPDTTTPHLARSTIQTRPQKPL